MRRLIKKILAANLLAVLLGCSTGDNIRHRPPLDRPKSPLWLGEKTARGSKGFSVVGVKVGDSLARLRALKRPGLSVDSPMEYILAINDLESGASLLLECSAEGKIQSIVALARFALERDGKVFALSGDSVAVLKNHKWIANPVGSKLSLHDEVEHVVLDLSFDHNYLKSAKCFRERPEASYSEVRQAKGATPTPSTVYGALSQ